MDNDNEIQRRVEEANKLDDDSAKLKRTIPESILTLGQVFFDSGAIFEIPVNAQLVKVTPSFASLTFDLELPENPKKCLHVQSCRQCIISGNRNCQ